MRNVANVFSRRFGAPLAVIAAIAAIIGLTMAESAVITRGNSSHAADHLAAAIPLAALAFVLVRECRRPRATRIARTGHRLIVIALGAASFSLGLEALGAFGYDGDVQRIKALTTLHNSSWIIQGVAMLALGVGLLFGAMSLAQRRPA